MDINQTFNALTLQFANLEGAQREAVLEIYRKIQSLLKKFNATSNAATKTMCLQKIAQFNAVYATFTLSEQVAEVESEEEPSEPEQVPAAGPSESEPAPARPAASEGEASEPKQVSENSAEPESVAKIVSESSEKEMKTAAKPVVEKEKKTRDKVANAVKVKADMAAAEEFYKKLPADHGILATELEAKRTVANNKKTKIPTAAYLDICEMAYNVLVTIPDLYSKAESNMKPAEKKKYQEYVACADKKKRWKPMLKKLTDKAAAPSGMPPPTQPRGKGGKPMGTAPNKGPAKKTCIRCNDKTRYASAQDECPHCVMTKRWWVPYMENEKLVKTNKAALLRGDADNAFEMTNAHDALALLCADDEQISEKSARSFIELAPKFINKCRVAAGLEPFADNYLPEYVSVPNSSEEDESGEPDSDDEENVLEDGEGESLTGASEEEEPSYEEEGSSSSSSSSSATPIKKRQRDGEEDILNEIVVNTGNGSERLRSILADVLMAEPATKRIGEALSKKRDNEVAELAEERLRELKRFRIKVVTEEGNWALWDEHFPTWEAARQEMERISKKPKYKFEVIEQHEKPKAN